MSLPHTFFIGRGGAEDALTVDQVFSTTVYTGNDSEKSIVNGIDLANEGGLVWIKNRGIAFNHQLFDTVRGATKGLSSNSISTTNTDAQTLKSFNSNGFTLGSGAAVNNSSTNVSWSFRKAPKFMTIVQYSGNGASSERSISHDLGGDVGAIFVKRIDTDDNWYVGCWKGKAHNNGWKLNLTDSVSTYGYFGTTAPTASTFHVSSFNGANASGGTYIAYLFADNSSEDAADRMIKCGKYTGNGNYTTGNYVDVGFEPQFILQKAASTSGHWAIIDTMRGWEVNTGNKPRIRANVNNAESLSGSGLALTGNSGFTIFDSDSAINGNGQEYIYMAVRAPMMAEIKDATKLFALQYARAAQDGVKPEYRSGFPVDMRLTGYLSGGSSSYAAIGSRKTGKKYMATSGIAQEGDWSAQTWDYMNGFMNTAAGSTNTTLLSYMWRRAKGYFDVTTHTGTGSATTFPHSLGVPSEMIWCKRRDGSGQWAVYHAGNTASPATQYLNLSITNATNTSSASWNNTAPTSTVFSVGTAGGSTNDNNEKFICYHFASLAGVSKLGSYVGNGTANSGDSQNISCGFSSGARFVLIKKTSAAGHWTLFDTVRGIGSGNDPLLRLNNQDANVTYFSSLAPLSSGFTVQASASDLNDNGANYIFYAIA
jgi:hypothetical protein